MRRYAALLLLGVLLVVSLLGLRASLRGTAELTWADRAVLRITGPAQRLMTWAIDGVASVFSGYVVLVGLRDENEALREELARLRAEHTRLTEEAAENQRLRGLLAMREDTRLLDTVAARVIGVGVSPFHRAIRVAAGTADGVAPGMAVVGGGGLVGRVLAAGAREADVLLLIDHGSAVDAVVQRTRARGIVKGLGEAHGLGCRIDYLERTDDVARGDGLVTSGIGGVFPPGLKVGTVRDLDRPAYGLYQSATLAPAVDFSRLEEVMVVLSSPPAVQQAVVPPR